MSTSETLRRIDAVLSDPRWTPYRGWHDDHRDRVETPDYRPAMMQVRGEFVEFFDRALASLDRRSCLQLGLGNCDGCFHALPRG